MRLDTNVAFTFWLEFSWASLYLIFIYLLLIYFSWLKENQWRWKQALDRVNIHSVRPKGRDKSRGYNKHIHKHGIYISLNLFLYDRSGCTNIPLFFFFLLNCTFNLSVIMIVRSGSLGFQMSELSPSITPIVTIRSLCRYVIQFLTIRAYAAHVGLTWH